MPGLFGIIESLRTHRTEGHTPIVIDAIREFFDTYLRGSWTSIIDIGLVAIVIYWLFILIRGTRAVRIVIGLSILYLVYLAAIFFRLDLLRTLMETAALAGWDSMDDRCVDEVEDVTTWCTDGPLALEAAYGHAAMDHPATQPTGEHA